MRSLRHSTQPTHPPPGAVPTAAQKALLQERGSLTSVNAAAMASLGRGAAASTTSAHTAATAAAAPDDDEEGAFAVSLSQVSPAAAAAPAPTQPQQPSPSRVRSERSSAADGMRREWKFALQFVHVAAQLLVPCSPQWEYEFIDIDRTAYGLAQRDRAATEIVTAPMLAVLSYTDRTAVVLPGNHTPSTASASPGGVSLQRQSTSGSTTSGGRMGGVAGPGGYDELLSNASLAGTGGVGAAGAAGVSASASIAAAAAAAGAAERAGAAGDGAGWWVEKSKHVELVYCHPPPEMTLEEFCKHCVRFVLRDPHVVSVDGDTRLTRLRIGDKLRCPHRLGGQHRSFHMRYVLRDRSELLENCVYVIGALVGQRGYLLQVRCTNAEELEGYVRTALLPTFATEGKSYFGVDVTYHNVAPTALLNDQQEAFGELQYVDHKAAIVFVTPVYPMKILPDYSPAKTVGVGSITCMTLELSVHERLLDDAVAAEIIGVAKYRVNPVVMCVEVEEVSRMGYPKVMSTEQYSDLKAARVADVFPDAKMIGLPTSLYMGDRTGRSRTMTFTYEPLRCVVKALVTSTLVGNFGVTAFYLTKLSGGLFDAHLYVFQQLLSGMEYLPQNNFAKNARVSRYRVQNIRLGEEDVIRAYRCTDAATPVIPGAAASALMASVTASETTTPHNASLQLSGTVPVDASLNSPLLPPHPTAFTTHDPRVVAAARERHLHMLALGNDGRVEGGIEAMVPVEEGGVPGRRGVSAAAGGGGHHGRHHHIANGGGGGRRGTAAGAGGDSTTGWRPPSASVFSASRSMLTVVSMLSGGHIAGAAGMNDPLRNGYRGSATATGPGAGEGDELDDDEDDEGEEEAELSSAHSNSRISVEDIAHLMESLTDSMDHHGSSNEDEDDDDAASRLTGSDVHSSLTSQEAGWAAGQDGGAAAGPGGRRPSQGSTGGRRGSDASANGSWGSGHRGSRPSSSILSGAGVSRGSVDMSFPAASTHSASPLTATKRQSVERDAAGAADTEEQRAAEGSAGVNSHAAGAAGLNDGSEISAEEKKQRELYEQLVGKGDPAVQQALREGEGGTLYGPSLRDVYARCCEAQRCRPNSYLMQKLPAQPEFTYSVEELDLSSNYVGHNGFVAVLHLLEHLPRLRVVYFHNMSLDNSDVESLCYVLSTNHSVREVHLDNNTGISLPSTRHFAALLRVNKRIEVLTLDGTRLSPTLAAKLQAEAAQHRDQ